MIINKIRVTPYFLARQTMDEKLLLSVLKYLLRHPKKSRDEIAKYTGQSIGVINRVIRFLKDKEVLAFSEVKIKDRKVKKYYITISDKYEVVSDKSF